MNNLEKYPKWFDEWFDSRYGPTGNGSKSRRDQMKDLAHEAYLLGEVDGRASADERHAEDMRDAANERKFYD